jgi:hypothetical protein
MGRHRDNPAGIRSRRMVARLPTCEPRARSLQRARCADVPCQPTRQPSSSATEVAVSGNQAREGTPAEWRGNGRQHTAGNLTTRHTIVAPATVGIFGLRITTAGTIHLFAGRARRGAVGRQRERQLDRADHHQCYPGGRPTPGDDRTGAARGCANGAQARIPGQGVMGPAHLLPTRPEHLRSTGTGQTPVRTEDSKHTDRCRVASAGQPCSRRRADLGRDGRGGAFNAQRRRACTHR